MGVAQAHTGARPQPVQSARSRRMAHSQFQIHCPHTRARLWIERGPMHHIAVRTLVRGLLGRRMRLDVPRTAANKVTEAIDCLSPRWSLRPCRVRYSTLGWTGLTGMCASLFRKTRCKLHFGVFSIARVSGTCATVSLYRQAHVDGVFPGSYTHHRPRSDVRLVVDNTATTNEANLRVW